MLIMGEEAKRVGRKIFTLLELDLEMCGNVYGQAPCTAEGEPGQECYNTWETCVDSGNYTRETKTISFVPNTTALPIGLIAYPLIHEHPTITPAELEIMQGIGTRGACEIALIDAEYPDNLDPYKRTRLEPAQGTFWGRFRARFPYYKERLMRVYVGYDTEPFSKENLSERLYFIENISGPDTANKMKITGKDILKSLSDERNNAPLISYAEITEDLSESETRIDYIENPDYPLLDGPAYIEIGEEIIHYETKGIDELTGCTRAAWGTDEKEVHEIGSSIQQCLYYEFINIIDVFYDLLVNYGGVDDVYIPYEDWEAERDLWLLPNMITAILAAPAGIDTIIAELCESHAVNMWWDELRQEIRIKAISPEPLNAAIPAFNDIQNFLADSVQIRDDDSNQITQLWLYYGVNDPTNDLTDPGNFHKMAIGRDHAAESPNEFGINKIRKIFSNWINFNQTNLALTIINRILVKSSKNQKKVNFALDAKDVSVWLGDNIVLQSRKAQTAAGRVRQLQVTITKAKEVIPGTRYEFEGVGDTYEPERYGYITENDYPKYSDATDEQKRIGGFMSDEDLPFPDGGQPYKII